MDGKNTKIQPELGFRTYVVYHAAKWSFVPKYGSETGVSTDVQASTWLDQDFNVVFLGAIYSQKMTLKKLKALVLSMER